MTKIELKLITPTVPNFIFIEVPPGHKQDGFKESPKIAVGDLSDRQLDSIILDWSTALLEVAARQRLNKKTR